jgi:ATP-binding cassette subfamily G (WHITE) protein 2 (SNQ2)
LFPQPITFGFEAMLTNEFHTISGKCSNLVPAGPGYENISLVNQACATVGSIPGEAFVNGDRFVELSFGYVYKNLWRVGRSALFVKTRPDLG